MAASGRDVRRRPGRGDDEPGRPAAAAGRLAAPPQCLPRHDCPFPGAGAVPRLEERPDPPRRPPVHLLRHGDVRGPAAAAPAGAGHVRAHRHVPRLPPGLFRRRDAAHGRPDEAELLQVERHRADGGERDGGPGPVAKKAELEAERGRREEEWRLDRVCAEVGDAPLDQLSCEQGRRPAQRPELAPASGVPELHGLHAGAAAPQRRLLPLDRPGLPAVQHQPGRWSSRGDGGFARLAGNPSPLLPRHDREAIRALPARAAGRGDAAGRARGGLPAHGALRRGGEPGGRAGRVPAAVAALHAVAPRTYLGGVLQAGPAVSGPADGVGGDAPPPAGARAGPGRVPHQPAGEHHGRLRPPVRHFRRRPRGEFPRDPGERRLQGRNRDDRLHRAAARLAGRWTRVPWTR